MSDVTDQPEAGPPTRRGEAAWKAEREEIAARNAQATKRGKQAREAHEREMVARHRATERRQDAGLGSTSDLR
ncbi:MAG: hypothetical protein M3N16_04515 [Actinomycetota bacterium]|nr:hypothetical protein [Actinomycetota bacterium]